jgi:hypothetical protein
LGLPAALAAWLLAEPRRPERRLALAAGLVAVAVVVLSETNAATHVKPFTRVSGAAPASDRWTPLNRVVGCPPPNGRGSLAYVFYDSIYAPAMVRRPGQPIPDWNALRLGPQSIGYELTGPGAAPVIWGGGG